MFYLFRLRRWRESLHGDEPGDGRVPRVSPCQGAVDGLDSVLDPVIDQLVDRELARKELVKAFKTRLLFKGKDGGLKEANVAKSTPEGIAMFKKGVVNEGYICLNDLPIEEVINIYLEATQ
jgi:hypothetical protein